MEFEQILKIISLAGSFGLIFYSWQKFIARFEKYSYSIAQLLFLLPMVLNFDTSLADTWTRHIIFYVAQITLFFFLNSFINKCEKKQYFRPENLPVLAVVPLTIADNSNILRWFSYLTEQGIEHFLALPLLFLTVTMVRLKIITVTLNTNREFVNWTVAGVSIFMAIHIGEFLVESQNIIHVEVPVFILFEYSLFLAALACFFTALLKLSDNTSINNENQI